MPELPEVETTRRGIEPHILNATVKDIIVREYKLRWRIPKELEQQLPNQTILKVERRAKYLLLKTKSHCLIIHLGMSGSLRILEDHVPAEKHDHVDIILSCNILLRYRDPRKFGALFWTAQNPLLHPRLIDLGLEPLSKKFDDTYLFQQSRKKTVCVKSFIMNAKILVGVGNIYASEALYLAGIDPRRAAGRISKKRYGLLVQAVQKVLTKAIKYGGTTLRDFTKSDGAPGYFAQKLNVYDKNDLPCPSCNQAIKQIKLNQRSSYYCPKCQS